MQITSPSDTTTASKTTSTPPPAETGAISSDFETFLLMLTTQMQNQDPLNPLESSEFAVQLATFSGVEQQVKTNELLATLVSDLTSSAMTEMASWIGKDVRTDGPAFFDGEPLTLYPNRDAEADLNTLVVRDADGQVVGRNAIAGDGAITWAGVGPDGNPLPSGLYRFEVETSTGGAVTGATSVEHYGRVNEVRAAGSGPELVLEGGATAPAGSVISVRDPAPG